jgi:hypothetical protein
MSVSLGVGSSSMEEFFSEKGLVFFDQRVGCESREFFCGSFLVFLDVITL